ncbi:phenylacetate--CoA ligase family protein [Legionella waltersii]|uniref:Coenzyme F390 synthetase n=1 Tax=Legionella waltersii TaxID=66969 RepID=A0A0W1A5D1_9GAMM|nr:phenylacetate--CoA ligase family protein [Legionella waltersii]KTD76567.1 coenzyme F390 synthetase [Legionella waltersii]SNU94179.1 Coenzyme F390 synthetase [Legionella waltersii]
MALYHLFQRLYQNLSRKSWGANKKQVTERLISKQTQYFFENYQKHHDGLHCSKQTLQQIRDERLRSLLTHAKLNSPWYKKTLAHIDIQNFTVQNLNELPTINKSILMDNWDAIVTDRRLTLALLEKHLEQKTHEIDELYLFNRYHVVTTGSTSGKRGVFIFDWDEWNTYYTCFVRNPLYNHERTQLLFNPTQKLKIVYFFTKNITFTAYAFIKSFQFTNNEHYCFPMTAPIAQICTNLNQMQPDVLISMPSFIYKLCQEAYFGRLNIQPKAIFVGAETHYAQFQTFIKEVWPNVSVFNTYSSTEGVLGMNCRANHDEMHLNEDLCIVEPIDEHNNPVAKGVLSNKQYITNLYNYTLPLIRYESSDHLLFLDKTCDCGIQHQLIVSPGGRSEFDFIYSENTYVNHSLFVKLLLAEKNIQEYQVIQTRYGADIKILTKGMVDKVKLQKTISEELSKVGLHQPRINILEVTQFEYLLSGKLRRFLKMNGNAMHRRQLSSSTKQDFY